MLVLLNPKPLNPKPLNPKPLNPKTSKPLRLKSEALRLFRAKVDYDDFLIALPERDHLASSLLDIWHLYNRMCVVFVYMYG